MTTDNKTLAEVQPGGRMRLGDQARVTISDELLTRMAYAIPGAVETTDKAKAVAARFVEIYLSAQPSPGGQGDARRQWLEVRGLAAGIVKNLQAFADSPHKGAWCGALDDALSFADQIEKDAAAAYESILAARQPVGEAVSEAIEQLADDVESCVSDACGYLASNSGWDDYGIYRDDAADRYRALPDRIRALAAPPAQAVDLGAMPDGWRLSKKTTCYQLSHGNDIIGNLVGPDAEENAAIIARVLDSQVAGK